MAFGGGVGVPVLLLVLLGSAGITSILEAFLNKREARDYITVVLAMIAQDEVLRRARASLREAMAREPIKPQRFKMPKEQYALVESLLEMDPYDFERHVMSFFQRAGLLAWVTKQSNDAGVDGFARHPKGIALVQCKRHGRTNFIGRPAIQQFKGVIEENEAWRGYFVTTSRFTQGAIESARKNAKIVLVDIDALVAWHQYGVSFDSGDPQPFEHSPILDLLDELTKSLPRKKTQQVRALKKVYAQGFLSDQQLEDELNRVIGD